MAMRRRLDTILGRWAGERERIPLLLYGPRRAGKTWALLELGRTRFDGVVHLNFERDRDMAPLFAREAGPSRVLRDLALLLGRAITPKTLLILAEVQACADAVRCLERFRAETPAQPVAATSSMFAAIVDTLGRAPSPAAVRLSPVPPMDFEEFLWARGREDMAGAIRERTAAREPMPEPLHEACLRLYREYLLVGGMPQAVLAFLDDEDFAAAASAQAAILEALEADTLRAGPRGLASRAAAVFASLPAQLLKSRARFQYGLVRRGGTALGYERAVEWLERSGLILRSPRVEEAALPLSDYALPLTFRAYMPDTGLLARRLNAAPAAVLFGAGGPAMDALVENYAAQQLRAAGHDLYCWVSPNQVPLDFVLERDAAPYGIEAARVIPPKSQRLRSFMRKYGVGRSCQLSEAALSDGGAILALPLYAAFCLQRP